jgi:hypothetical protein
MSGGAFNLLKSGQNGPETAKQAEIRLADLLKSLGNASSRASRTLGSWEQHAMVVFAEVSAGYG